MRWRVRKARRRVRRHYDGSLDDVDELPDYAVGCGETPQAP